jgi:hypothetical protein
MLRHPLLKYGFMLILLIVGLLVLSIPAMAQDEVPANDVVWPEQYYAPYMDMGRYPTINLTKTAEASGIKHFTLAFVLTGYKNCKAAWFGVSNLKNPLLLDDLETLRALGGDVIVSFGGAGGRELAQFCPDVASLTEQYQLVIDTLGLTHLDFDIEGGRESEAESVERRSAAIAQLQADAAEAGRQLSISFTLPVLTTGLTEGAIGLLQSAIDAGVDIDVVNIMTMNFEESAPPNQMGDNVMQAAQSLFDQLKVLYPDKDDASLWQMIGLTPMIGVNDRPTQIFTVEDAEAVTEFALEKGLKLIAIWSLDRDQPCEFEQQIATSKCSSVEQEPLAFSLAFNALTTANGTP